MGQLFSGSTAYTFCLPSPPRDSSPELVSVWQLSKLASGCQGRRGGGAEQEEAISTGILGRRGRIPVKALKSLHLGMGSSWKFWFPQTRLLKHSPGCGCLYSRNSLVYTTFLDANRPMDAVEAVGCAAGEDSGVGFAHVVLTRLHITAYSPAAQGENENLQSAGPLSRPSAWARDNRSGVNFDSCHPFLHNPPRPCFPSPIAHHVFHPPRLPAYSGPVTAGSECIMPLHACCSSSGCFLCSQCPLPFLWIPLSLLSQSVLYAQLMGHQMALGRTQAEFLFYAIYITLGLRHSEQRKCIYNGRGRI